MSKGPKFDTTALRALMHDGFTLGVGIVLNGGPTVADSESENDRLAAKLAEAEQIHLFAMPLLNKEYPAALEHKLSEAVRPGDMDIIAKPCDYLGWNYYTRAIVRAGADGGPEIVPPRNDTTDMGWEVYPEGLKELCHDLAAIYDLPPLYITENGAAYADELADGAVHDKQRFAYLQDHLRAVAELKEEGIDIRGYVCWTLMDNFEWAEGYSKRFGLVHVDFATQVRTIKDSGKAFAGLNADKARLAIAHGENCGDVT